MISFVGLNYRLAIVCVFGSQIQVCVAGIMYLYFNTQQVIEMKDLNLYTFDTSRLIWRTGRLY